MKGPVAAIGLMLLAALGCTQPTEPAKPALTLATTTSVRDSGLLDVLVPLFERRTGIPVKVVAVGSGQALELGRRGDADVLLTHAPEAEARFMAAGHGTVRSPLMHNSFVLVGPRDDPACVREAESVSDALSRIAAREYRFVSRGDESGTHNKEQQLWNGSGIEPRGDWYIQAGAGMAEVLRMADQKRAYTLSDRGTFLAQKRALDLQALYADDPQLINRYSVLVVRPSRHSSSLKKGTGSRRLRRKRPNAAQAEDTCSLFQRTDDADRHAGAKLFAEFLISDEIQKVIASFGVEQFGEPLFIPEQASRPTERETAASGSRATRRQSPASRR